MASRPTGADEETPEAKAPLLASSDDGQTTQATQASLVCKALNSTADLAKHLPTGAVLAFEVLSPSFTADGSCTAANRALTACLVGACALCCFLLCFTDSYRDATGSVRYGFVTPSGSLRLIDSGSGSGSPPPPPPRDDRYRLGARDVLHGALSFAVFLAVAMVDRNVVACFYPVESPATRQLVRGGAHGGRRGGELPLRHVPVDAPRHRLPRRGGRLTRVHTDRLIELPLLALG
ncbi:hypothetical protein OsJ_06732 [Oryza sativa Japonica Group]|uniref:Uncharacterized protein n=1 Tax=Oryza sativa subsp. japonica TaxID=39947 RepID=A3A6U8_ORYSJ|nr:hypothetical protein OsJ_06732 [Oryza sativa Japonica Group]